MTASPKPRQVIDGEDIKQALETPGTTVEWECKLEE